MRISKKYDSKMLFEYIWLTQSSSGRFLTICERNVCCIRGRGGGIAGLNRGLSVFQ